MKRRNIDKIYKEYRQLRMEILEYNESIVPFDEYDYELQSMTLEELFEEARRINGILENYTYASTIYSEKELEVLNVKYDYISGRINNLVMCKGKKLLNRKAKKMDIMGCYGL